MRACGSKTAVTKSALQFLTADASKYQNVCLVHIWFYQHCLYCNLLTLNSGHFCVCFFQYLHKNRHLPEFERFLAVEPGEQIVAPMFRSRDALPNWFAMFEELSVYARLPTKSRPVRSEPVKLYPKNADNTRSVWSLLPESANVTNAAMGSVILPDHCHLLSTTVTAVTVSQDASCSVPTSDVAVQHYPVDVAASTNVTESDVLIITADQLQQLGLDASILPLVTTSNCTQLDTSVFHYVDSEMPDNGSIPMSSHEMPASVGGNQPATSAVTTSPNLIGRAFASAVGISVDELSSFGDREPGENEWHLPPSTSSLVTTAVAGDVLYSTARNSVTVQVSKQSVTASVANVSFSFADSLSNEANKHIFTSCDVDVSALDITMLNSSLSPAMPSHPCDDLINNDSTLATPKKMVLNPDDETVRTLPVAEAKMQASDVGRMSQYAASLAVATDGRCPVSSKDSEVRIFGVSSTSTGSLENKVFTSEVGTHATMTTVSGLSNVSFVNLAPVPSPVHGMALISSTPHQMSAVPGSNDIKPASVICSASSSRPLSAGAHKMSLPYRRTNQVSMQHARSPSKCLPYTQRPILPQSVPSFSPSKFLTSLSPVKLKQKKLAAKASTKALPVIAPKVMFAKSYMSPVKQVAASITARARRLQSSPSRGDWYTASRLKTVESPGCSVTPGISVVIKSPDARTPANDNEEEDEAVSGDGEEQSTDVDSQLEDEVEEDSLAMSAEQSPSSYVQLLSLFNVLDNNTKPC